VNYWNKRVYRVIVLILAKAIVCVFPLVLAVRRMFVKFGWARVSFDDFAGQ